MKKINVKELLKKKLTKKELAQVPSSYDMVGDILIFADFPKSLIKKQKIIGNTFLKTHKHIKVIAKKTKKYSGPYRLPKLTIVAGEKRKETVYKENNIRLKLNVEKVYFSPRLSTERKRIYEQVKPKETILVMFSGCSPYPIVISKNTKAKEIYAIEINPIAYDYAVENVKLNKTHNITLFNGDVRDIIPIVGRKFERIIMPLPRGGENFLELALKPTKKGTVIHFYDFLHEDEFKQAEKKVKTACKKAKKKCKILKTVKCGQFGPRIYRLCVDFKLTQ